jgi:hypothetical protein
MSGKVKINAKECDKKLKIPISQQALQGKKDLRKQ